MDVTYEQKPEMTFIGFSTTIRADEGYQKCPEFWDREYSKKYERLWQTMQSETPIEKAILENEIGTFAICDEKEGSFAYWIAGLYKGGEVPEGLALYTFPESDWAMFSAKGALPDSLQALNTKIWQEWYPDKKRDFTENGAAMLEVYTPGNMQSTDYECGIWVPIRKLEQTADETAEIIAEMMLQGLL